MLGVAAVLLVAMAGRRKELAILRAMGVAPTSLLGYVLLESVLVCSLGILAGEQLPPLVKRWFESGTPAH